MALIVRCRRCRIRIPEDDAACPECGATERRYIVDYWPEGRKPSGCTADGCTGKR